MPTDKLNAESKTENARTLASILGLSIEDASNLLDIDVLISFNPDNACSEQLAEEVTRQLERTVSGVCLNDFIGTPAIEIIIGDSAPKTKGKILYIAISGEQLNIQEHPFDTHSQSRCHPILTIISACYVCAATMSKALELAAPHETRFPLNVNFNDLTNPKQLDSPFELGMAFMAGAGAVGNGFLWALKHMNAKGILTIADDDTVDAGNLNRQIWFAPEDVGLPKVKQIALRAKPFFSDLELNPVQSKVQDLPEILDNAKSLKTLIVGVDSRRARRTLQNLIPGEVFDASTTDITEIVLHHHKQPNDGACLSCIYYANEQELNREQLITEQFGLPVEVIKMQRISSETAAAISLRYPNQSFDPKEIEGLAFDTLFKSLCGAGALNTVSSTKQLFAPFCFVSILAGAMLALEVFNRRLNIKPMNYNYWKLSAWTPPIVKNQRQYRRIENCEFCGEKIAREIAANRWE